MKAKTLYPAMLVLLCIACSKLTVENYNKIESGMSYEAVSDILGKPESCDDMIGIKSCRWGDDQRKVIVNFVGNKVVLTSAENIR